MAGAIPGGFVPGSLVVISGLQEKVEALPGVGDFESEPLDLNGTKAQLIEWQDAADIWIASTLGGEMVGIGRKYLRLLKFDELETDLVVGPKTDPKLLASSIADLLADRGHASLSVILAERYRQEIYEASRIVEQDGKFSRLPMGFERGHLGEDGKGKIFEVGAYLPQDLMSTQLSKQNENISSLSKVLSPMLKQSLGINISERTPLLLRLPFDSVEDEAKYIPPAISNSEADSFLEVMGRRKLGVLQFLGPDVGTLKLLPKDESMAEVSVAAAPNTMILFLPDRYSYRLETQGELLSLSSWFLEPVKSYKIYFEGPSASSETLASSALSSFGKGPAASKSAEIKCVGIGSRDPCNANNEEHFWLALRHAACDGALMIPHSRFDVDHYIYWKDQQIAMQHGASYCRHQGHIEGIDIFDEKFFNIPKDEVYGMDPCQRIICETGWGALASANYDVNALRKDSAHMSFQVGISGSDWPNVIPPGVNAANGIPETFIANRFSFIMNLKGPSFIANTACSASLVALHAGRRDLLALTDPLEGAVCAGISLNLSPGTWIANCAAGMLSFRGRSFSFTDSADGYGRGEGSACIVMKRGRMSDEDAFALVACSNVNSDGRSASLTAPNGPAQQRLLKAIVDETKLNISEISTYEAHGTGTMLGDPIELGACSKILSKGRSNQLCISCSKPNLSHLEGGAGISAFVKCLLSVMHTECLPMIHFNTANPNLSLEGYPQHFISEGLAYGWENCYVGVSGFGYGGTNAHVMAYGHKVARHGAKPGEADPESLKDQIIKKITIAPPPNIDTHSDQFEEWTTTGVPHLTAKEDDQFHIEVLPNGEIIWREMVEPDAPDVAPIPFIQGSFNDGGVDMLDSSDSEGFYTCEITLGETGEETFFISLDADPDLALFPDAEYCSKKSQTILGPKVLPTPEHVWLIKGEPDATYRVELFLSGSTKAINWILAES